jgi:hypothetical protein
MSVGEFGPYVKKHIHSYVPGVVDVKMVQGKQWVLSTVQPVHTQLLSVVPAPGPLDLLGVNAGGPPLFTFAQYDGDAESSARFYVFAGMGADGPSCVLHRFITTLSIAGTVFHVFEIDMSDTDEEEVRRFLVDAGWVCVPLVPYTQPDFSWANAAATTA